MTQRDLAARSGLSYRHLNGVVNGRRGLSDRNAARIARALGVHPAQFTTAVLITDYRAVDHRGTAA